MHLEILPYSLPLILAAIGSVVLAYYASKRREVPGAVPFMGSLLAAVLWSSCAAISLYQTHLETIITISNVQGIAHAIIPATWMIFAMRYTGSDRWITLRLLCLLAIEPVVFEALLWTDTWHGLMRTANWLSYEWPFPIHHSTFGIGYWGHVVYTYTLMMVGTVLLFRELIRSYHQMYRGQVVALSIAASTPWVANMLQLASINLPIPYIMMTPMGLFISNVALAWGLFRYRLLDVMPVAKEAVLYSMRDGVVVLDNRGHIVEVNPAAQQMIGKTGDAVIGQAAGDIRPEWGSLLKDMKPDGTSKTVETVTTEGITKQYELHLTPINNRNQVRSGWLLVLLDTTDRMLAEEERLKISKLESLSVMAAGIAHDFNNTLAGVMGYLSMAKLEIPPDTRASEHVSLAEESALHASTLVRQMMTFAKGGQPLKAVETIGTVVFNADALVPREANIERICQLPVDLWPVEVDAGQIAQVLQNLIINAQQAMPRGGTIKITGSNETVETEGQFPGTHLKNGFYIRIAISDTGVGIPPEVREKIFDPYFTTKKKGTGLGLTSSYTIVQRHDGAITVTSVPGKGTTFEVFLPARPDLAQPLFIPQDSLADQRVPKPKSTEQTTRKILVMDDEPVIRRLAYEGLTQFGYAVTCVADGVQALEAYAEALENGEKYAIVVMDLTVSGGMGGKEAMSTLLKMDPDARVIVSSGYSSDPIMAGYREHGFLARVVKPYRIKDLADAVQEAINHREELL